MRVPIITWLRKSKTFKMLMAFAGLSFLSEICFPTAAWALTSGPAQEEFASFEPVSTSDMVDIYSGDFNYNIPLLSVPGPNGGYPINLAYHSGIGMDQEASWVGLGWNVNVGAINRQLRGLPDDFNGDIVTQKMNLRPNWTAGVDMPLNFSAKNSEKFGIPFTPEDAGDNKFKPSSLQVYYNNYKGLGYRILFSCDRNTKWSPLTAGVGVSYDSQNGIGIEPNLSLKASHNINSLDFKFGLSYNSRQGLQDFNFSGTVSAGRIMSHVAESGRTTIVGAGIGFSSSMSFGFAQSVAGIVQFPIATRPNAVPTKQIAPTIPD